MTIKLNEYDKRLLSQITPASKWDKLKSIYAINSVIKQLKIGNKKIGLKCAKHLQKLSKQNTTSLQEIKEGCRDLKIPKQKIPLAKDKTKRPVESTHKINKATDKAPTDKTKGGGRKGGGGGGGGKAQPQADLIGGLFTAFKAQEAKQARDSQFNVLSSEMNRAAQNINRGVFDNRNIDLARVEQQARESAGVGRAFGSQDTALQQLKVNLLLEREAKEQGDSNVPSLTSAQNRVLDALLNDERPNPEDLLKANPEQDLTNVSIPSTPRTVSSSSSLSTISSSSSSSMFNPTEEEKNKLAMQLLVEREKNLSTIQKSVERKQGMLKEKVAEADIYAEEQRQSMIKNKIGIQTENYINRAREEIKSNVLNNNMHPKEAQKKLQQLNTFYLKQLEYEQQQRVNQNIFNDIEELERDRQFRLRNRKVGVDSVLSRLRNRETQEQQDRLVNDLIINQNEKKMKDIQSELLGSVSSRAEKKENRQEQIDLLRARMRNQSVEQQETQGFTFNPPTNPDLSSIQQNVITNIEDRLEQQNADRAMREFVSRQNLNEFNQQAEPLSLTRTSSLSLLERMEADSLRQLQENQDLQRTLSAPTVQALDIGRADRKLKEQLESEAIFNRKQQELAQEIQNLKTEPPLMAFGEEDNITAKPIEKKVSPREEVVKEEWMDLDNPTKPFKWFKEVKYINRGDRIIKVDAFTGERLPLDRDYAMGDSWYNPLDMTGSSKRNQIKKQREKWDSFTEAERDKDDDREIEWKQKQFLKIENKKQRVEQEFLENKDKPYLGSWMGPKFSSDLGGGSMSEENKNQRIEKFDKEQELIKKMLDRLDIEYE